MINATDKINMDLHMHSSVSDGSDNPAEVVEKATAKGVTLLSLTDHDSVSGVSAAQNRALEIGTGFLPGIEMDAEFPEKLHILGIGIDVENKALHSVLCDVRERRTRRNELILRKLENMNMPVRERMYSDSDVITRVHIANAMVRAGYVSSKKEAFIRFIGDGKPAYAKVEKISPEHIIRTMIDAGGVPVLAHPCQMKCNIGKLCEDLIPFGLMGIEVYYPSATKGQIMEHISIAERLGLLVTCGSDAHGSNRPQSPPGCAWENVSTLLKSYEFFFDLAEKTRYSFLQDRGLDIL